MVYHSSYLRWFLELISILHPVLHLAHKVCFRNCPLFMSLLKLCKTDFLGHSPFSTLREKKCSGNFTFLTLGCRVTDSLAAGFTANSSILGSILETVKGSKFCAATVICPNRH